MRPFSCGFFAIAFLLCSAVSGALLPGCAASGPEHGTGTPFKPQANRAPERAAIVDGQLVTTEDLWKLLAERAGAAALEAVALDRAVEREAARLGLTITDDDVRAEREVVEQALVGVGLTDRTQRGRLVAEVRARRGLGPAWFDGLLRRNAQARKITASSVVPPTEADITRLHETLHGPRRDVRAIVMANERDLARLATDIARALEASPEAGLARFIVLAVEHSNDASRGRGGLLDPVGRTDGQYADAFRQAVFETPVGGLTPVVALDEGFALALVVAERSGDGVPMETARPDLLRRLELDAQQRAIAAWLERLRATMRVEPFDPALEWAWANRVR